MKIAPLAQSSNCNLMSSQKILQSHGKGKGKLCFSARESYMVFLTKITCLTLPL